MASQLEGTFVPRPAQVFCRTHCLFCLQSVSPPILQLVLETNPKKLTIQPVLHYLTGTDPTHDKSGRECERKGVPQMDKLPPMCWPCYEVMAQLHRLHEQLLTVQILIQEKIEVARGIVAKASVASPLELSPRYQFHGMLKGFGGRFAEKTEAVLKFVDGLHNQILTTVAAQGKRKMTIFPSSPPPDFIPSSRDRLDLSRGGDDDEEELIVPQVQLKPRTSSMSNSQSSSSTNSTDISEPMPTAEENKRKQGTVLARSKPDHPHQNCDLCREKVRFTDIESHLEAHGLKEYMTKCPNPECRWVFSCRKKMEGHVMRTWREINGLDRACRKVANWPERGAPPKKCETCNCLVSNIRDGLKIPQALWRHLQTHEAAIPEKGFLCPIPGCTERYALKQSVEEHIFTHDLRPQKREQECPMCKASTKVEEMAKHLRGEHQVEEVIPCQLCLFLFPSREYLLDHLSEHRSCGGIPCDLCPDGLKFRNHEHLRQHYFNVHQVGKQFLCEHCDKEFFALTTLSSHVRMKHSGEKKKQSQKLVKCDVAKCPYTCSSDLMRTHKIQKHGAEPIKCRYCDKQFMKATSWRYHERGHTGLVRTYKCPEGGCGKEFRAKKMWIHHKLNGHSRTKPLICDHCGTGFSFKKSLQAHVKKIHLGLPLERNHICETCGEKFSSGQTLERHNLIHTGERPFSCHLCGQAFRHKEVLRRHLKGHEEKGSEFKPNGPMKQVRKRVERND